jgi:hypothetical protein
MNLAQALAVAHSGRFQSPSAASRAFGTEIGLARAGYAGAVLPLSAFAPAAIPGMGTGPHACPGLLEMGVGAAAPRDTARVAGWQEGDLCPRGARSRQWGLESPEGRTARAGGTRGTN